MGRAGKGRNAELGSGREEVFALAISHAVAVRCQLKLPSSEGSAGLGVHSGTLTHMARG